MQNLENMGELLSSISGAEVSIIPVMSSEGPLKVDESQLPESLPILALRNAVVFPGTIYPITIGRPKSVRLVEDAVSRNLFIGAIPQASVSVEDPQALEDFNSFGTVCRVIKTFEMPDGSISALLQGIKRIRLYSLTDTEPYHKGLVHYYSDLQPAMKGKELKLVEETLKDKAGQIIRSSSFAPKEAVTALGAIDDFAFLVNFIATTIEVDNFGDKAELLSYDDIGDRAMHLLTVLDTQLELLKIKQEINSKVKSEIDQQQNR